MGYPSDDTFEQARAHRAPPRKTPNGLTDDERRAWQEFTKATFANGEVLDITVMDAGQIAEQVREYAARKTYPLYCVDRQDRVSPEHQYRGPFATHDEAHEQAEPGDLVRRCRRVRATEVSGWRFALGALMMALDEQATSGDAPDGAWGDFEDEVAHAGDGLADAIGAVLDEHVRVDAYICEGDE